MEKGLFFNAFPNPDYETGYDRNYSADDISNWLQAVITNGVIKTDSVAGTGEAQGLKVLADSGLNIKVNSGMAVIKGKPYINNSILPITLATAPTTGTRYDCVILRMDNTQVIGARKTYCLIESLDHVPTEADLTRNDNVYDLLLAYVVVNANATSIQQTNINDTRGDETLCPWCTAVKGYEDYYDAIVQRFESDITLASAGSVVVTDLAVSLYNDKYSLVSVYCNGLREDEADYTIDVSNQYVTIRFTANKSANAQISVILENFIDGEGLESVLEQYNQLVEEVANLNKVNEFNYYCNGVNDNVEISNLVKNFIENNSNAYKTLKLNIIGTLGISAPASGDGSNASPFCIFNFGSTQNYNRFELDFSHCDEVYYQLTSGKQHIFFKGSYGHFIGLTLNVINDTYGTSVKVFSDDGKWLVEGCRFVISSYRDAILGYCGTFINCRARVHNVVGSSWVFFPRVNKLLSIIGGEYTAYTEDNTNDSKSALIGETTNGNVVLSNVNLPTIARSGEYQTHAIYKTNGTLSAFGLITTLTITAPNSTITGTLNVNLAEQVW